MPFGFFLRSQVEAFVILFIERDGSTFLISALSSHPQISTAYERFAVLKQRGADASEQMAWADQYYTFPLMGRTAAVGFKTKLVDVPDLDAFRELLRKKKCKIIHMKRANSVKAVISRINAKRLWEATGYWNLYKDKDRMPPMDIDPYEFDQFIKERAESDQLLDDYVFQLDLPTLLIKYEDLLIDRDGQLERVFSFLNVPPKTLEIKTKKHTSDDLREIVNNLDELRANYIGTKYEPMFYEVLVPTVSEVPPEYKN